MLREISTEILIDMNINAHQAIIALLLMGKQYDYLENYLKETSSYDTFEADLKRLTSKHLVTYDTSDPYKYKSILVKTDFIRRFTKGDNFMELYTTYPIKVSRPDGMSDYLRKDRRMCRDVYTIVTKDDQDYHDHVMRCLKFEINHRKNTNTLKYMKRMSKWLSEREWENYEDVVDDASLQNQENTYGTQFI